MWSAVGSLALCVALLIASEFMPVSLLTPIARDLHATGGAAGQAISISGLFAVAASLLVPGFARRIERRVLLVGLTALMLLSLLVIAVAPSFTVLMVARALLGIVIGGFWALATATVMRLVPKESVPRALAFIYVGNAVATAFAAPIGSYLGGVIGWRGVFWALAPIVAVNLVWLWFSLPVMPRSIEQRGGSVFGLLRRPHVRVAMLGVMLTFAGAFCAFTYLRPFLEAYLHVDPRQLSLLLLGLGLAGFVGTYAGGALAGSRLYSLLRWLPLGLGAVTAALVAVAHSMWAVAIAMVLWGAINSAIPVAWSAWLARGVSDDPEGGGGLMVAAIQLAIMLGGAIGGVVLDHIAVAAPFIVGAIFLALASWVVGEPGRVVSERESEDTRYEYA